MERPRRFGCDQGTPRYGNLGDESGTRRSTAESTSASCPGPPFERIQTLLAQLDHNEFAQREEASRELKKLGAAAEPALCKLLTRRPSLEMARRVKAILATPPPWTPQDSETLRRRRAIQVLERIGSPAAGRILAKLAEGDAAAPETHFAKDVRDRARIGERVGPAPRVTTS